MSKASSRSRFSPLRFFRAPSSVPVVRLAGVIGGGGPLRQGLSLAGVAPVLERAFSVPKAQAVALVINSPGGSPVQSALIAQRIRDLAQEKKLPVLAFCEDVAASGGYWIACAADEIYVNENSLVGSIGVISAGFGFQRLLERWGVERRLYTAGERKALLDPFSPEDPEGVARLKAIQVEMHESFIGHVRARRGERLKESEGEIFTGEFWTGGKALKLGLVDGLGEPRSLLRQRFGEEVRLRRVDAPRPWWRRRMDRGVSRLLTGEGGGLLPESWAGDLISAAEERALWARYGL